MRGEMHIVDRLNIAIEEVSAARAALHEYTSESLPKLLMDARDRIHELEALTYSYPPSNLLVNGLTWREELDDMVRQLMGMTSGEFEQWQRDNG